MVGILRHGLQGEELHRLHAPLHRRLVQLLSGEMITVSPMAVMM